MGEIYTLDDLENLVKEKEKSLNVQEDNPSNENTPGEKIKQPAETAKPEGEAIQTQGETPPEEKITKEKPPVEAKKLSETTLIPD